MATIGEDLLTYLKAYNTEDHAKLTQSDDVPEALINAIYSKHKERFEAWRQIPMEFRDASGRVPEEIMQKAIRGETINRNTVEATTHPTTGEVLNVAADADIALSASDMAYITDVALKITLMGYGEKAAQDLATDRVIREKLTEIIKSGTPLSNEQNKVWTLTRERDRSAIMADWKENQPERYALHLIKKMNAGKIDPDLAMSEIGTYINKTFEIQREKQLRKALQSSATRLEKMSPETKQFLVDILNRNGMDTKLLSEKIQALCASGTPEQTPVQKTTLSQELLKTKNQTRDI